MCKASENIEQSLDCILDYYLTGEKEKTYGLNKKRIRSYFRMHSLIQESRLFIKEFYRSKNLNLRLLILTLYYLHPLTYASHIPILIPNHACPISSGFICNYHVFNIKE